MSRPTPNQDIAESERLKGLGNELYQKGEHDAAHHKYSEAIKKNPKNAVLYANRAAVLLATKQYLNALYDCEKAVQLDPAYSKAWGRLATAQHALASYPQAVEAWDQALSTLPATDRTPAQDAMELQFIQGLKKSYRAVQGPVETNISVLKKDELEEGLLPWDMARKLKARKEAEGKPSCVPMINAANEELEEAMELLSLVQRKKSPQGLEMSRGPVKVLEWFTNSTLSDDRIFHVKEGAQSWMMRMEKQCHYENTHWKGWGESGGPSLIKGEALKMLKKEGWNGVRPALAITVRIWIFLAHFRAKMFGQRDFAHEFYTNALDVLEWGRKTWPNAATHERGVIFEKTFIRGVKKLALENMHGIVATKKKDAPISLQELIEAAQELSEDFRTNPPASGAHTAPTILSFWYYPNATAQSILGWCYLEQALGVYPHNPEDPNAPPSPAEKESLLTTAAECYLTAARYIPPDDELHMQFLRKHLECLCARRRPLRETLPVCRRMRELGPDVMEIWASGSLYGEGVKENLGEVVEFEALNIGECMAGRMTPDDVAVIGFMKGRKRNMVQVSIPDAEGKPEEDKAEIKAEK
ncbi:hypothetical protein DFP72DRAFT_899716 [Ephemerocybe angulata]|uniref:TPR-like protein n=1 Tax=Ephemerocybe angulata TaxID=980116 RepID=A0A8H6HW07_9AGAR|nr:hypothetical protein DFP72DRAFT_899716 [Tulosesus angulatus]